MNVLVTGANGQLGKELAGLAPADVQVVALSRQQLDIADARAVQQVLSEYSIDVIVNAAAYTAVDKAEEERDEALRVNATACEVLAQCCADTQTRLVHVSTDYVFNGQNCRPYVPSDAAAPMSAYGDTKYRGEQAITSQASLHYNIVRVSWLYGVHGNNFVHTMLRLMNERDELGVVSDQIGTPTWTMGVSDALWALVSNANLQGIWHWSDLGVASWYDFAVAIHEFGKRLGLIDSDVTLKPIATEDYPTPAVRPAYSVMDSRALREAIGRHGVHWREQLFRMLEATKNG